MGQTDSPPIKTSLQPPKGLVRSSAIFLIRMYRRVLSPVMGGQCRFYPTCSHYAELSFRYLPLHEAAWRSLDRIGRCRPGKPGGIDFPPGLEDGSPFADSIVDQSRE